MSNRYLPHDWYPEPLPANVEIGPRSWLYSTFAFAHYASQRPVGLRVGHDSGLYNGTFFDIGPEGEVEIGDYCAIVGAIIASNSHVTIGDYAFISHEVVIADQFYAIPPNIESHANSAHSEQGIIIGENVWIGARASILGGVHVNDGAIVGAAAVVTEDVPPYSIVAGNPAQVVSTIKRRVRQW